MRVGLAGNKTSSAGRCCLGGWGGDLFFVGMYVLYIGVITWADGACIAWMDV